ncbi:hypothetical protein TIFTF001_012217 [Ficus carica]|uniref:Uncharacterized protein n=1 Tax=Ficus carica TaxID=3494 RepID=A0AA88AMZ5_FICCA|nr:hypothetical protein TIFTF001_012217 [Ficus carica]
MSHIKSQIQSNLTIIPNCRCRCRCRLYCQIARNCARLREPPPSPAQLIFQDRCHRLLDSFSKIASGDHDRDRDICQRVHNLVENREKGRVGESPPQ